MAEYFIGITDKGKRRENNEDTFIAREVFNNEFVVACVIDGVGGYNGGEVAAEIARAVIMEHLQDLSGDVPAVLRNAIIAANAKIQQEKKEHENNGHMACVLTCAVTHIKDNKFYYAHVGDTRLYLLRDSSLIKISKDHSAVGFLEESGRLSEEEAMRHPRRNEINKALGFEEQIGSVADYIEMGESPFLPGDTILLCSDGLSDMLSSQNITSILNTKKAIGEKAKDLIDAANEAGGNDNITAVLVENNKQPVKQQAIKPIERKSSAKASVLPASDAASGQAVSAGRKTAGKMIILLSLLSFGLLIALSFSLFQQQKRSTAANADIKTSIPKVVDDKLIQLLSRVNDTSRMYVLDSNRIFSDISDPISISKDSFYLKGNAATIECAPGYKGPALNISSNAKHIVLDSLTFKNFDVGLILQRNNVVLRNVRFINCRIPVQYLISFPDSILSGRFKDSIFINNSNLK